MSAVRRFVSAYGANPLHLLAMLASFALAGYAAIRMLPSAPIGIAVWFVGAAVAHDLLLLPLYAIVDTALVRTWRHRHRRDAAFSLPRMPWINYLRAPLLVSALLLLVYFPSIFRLADNFTLTTRLSSEHYLRNWLLVTAALFGLSAVAYAIRLRRVRSR